MQTNTRDLGFVNFNGQEMNFVNFNGVTVYEAWKKLIESGVPPLTLLKCKNSDLLNYKIFGNSVSQARLPQEYQEVEYIQTTGTQHIDSGVPLKSGLKAVIDWVYADADSGNNYTGGHIGSPGNRWLIGSQRNNNYYYFAVGATNVFTEFRFGNRDIVEAYWANKASYFMVNGVKSTTVKGENYALSEEPNYTFYMGAVDRDGNATLKPKLTIYSWKFYQDDVLIRDFIPCYRKSDGEIGMYDLVTNAFYTNGGTGTFVKGEVIPTKVESVGDKTSNLLNVNDSEMSSATFKYNVKNQIIKRTCIGNVQTSWLLQTTVFPDVIGTQVLEPGTYIWGIHHIEGIGLTASNSSITPYIQLQKSDGSTPIDWYCNTSITLTERATIIAIRSALINYGFNETQAFKIQINEGTELKDYELSGYKTPVKVTPTIYDFNLEKIDKIIYTVDGDTRFGFDLGILEAGQYTFDFNFIQKPNYIYLRIKRADGNFDTIHITTNANEKPRNPVTFTADGISNVYLIFASSSINTKPKAEALWNNVTSAYLQKTSNIQSETVDIYTKEPLRKNENYVDYTDYEKQKVFRNVMNTTFDGTENWEIHTAISGGSVFRLDNVLNPLINAPLSATYMSHFGLTNIYSTANFNTGAYRFSSNQEVNIITGNRLYISSSHTTLEEFKQWLSENRPMISYPIEELEENIDLPSVATQKDTNVIEVGTTITPSNLEVTYIGKK